MIQIDLPYCKALMIEAWNAPPGRYFISYLGKNAYRHVLGLAVVDEFASISSPIFFAPYALLGKIYNAGISLGHKRDPEMGIDLGWPPIVIGYDESAASLPESWETELLDALMKAKVPDKSPEIERTQIGECDIFLTSTPLLPKQLFRVCELSKQPFSIAISTGNRITRTRNSSALSLQTASEKVLLHILRKFAEI